MIATRADIVFLLASLINEPLDAFVVRGQHKQPGGGITLPREPTAPVIEFLRREAEIRSTTFCDYERVCCNVKRRPPMDGESVQGDRPSDGARIRC